MLGLFRALVDRVKAVLAVRAAQEIEADALAHAAERRAELLRRAAGYDAAGRRRRRRNCGRRSGEWTSTDRLPGSCRPSPA